MLSTGGMSSNSSAGEVQYCTFCRKPFTIVSSYKRHQSYCRRAQARPKKHQKSCRACCQAKAKCSLETCCARCTTRGLDCVYEHQVEGAARSNIHGSATPQKSTNLAEGTDLSTLIIPSEFDGNSIGLFWGDEQVISGSSTTEPSNAVNNGWNGQLTLFNDNNATSHLYDCSLDNPMTSSLLGTYCELGTLSRLTIQDPVVQRSANLVLQTLRTFPEKMLHGHYLPFFIHSHWRRNALAEPLAVCQRICQMFCTRTPDIFAFIWRCIRTEGERCLQEALTKEQLLAASQAQVVYIMMMVIESGMRRLEWVREMLTLSGAVCQRLSILCEQCLGQEDQLSPSAAWENWVFMESRRRKQVVWFIMSLVFSIQTGVSCTNIQEVRSLPLLAPKLQWEASNYATWEQHLTPCSDDGLKTIGNLIDICDKREEPVVAQKLDSWNAKTDQLGSLLNVAIAML